MKRLGLFTLALYCVIPSLHTQPLTLKQAVQTATANYGSIKAKSHYANATRATLSQSRRDYLPNLVVSAQQDYGTINGQNGPLYGFGGFGVASSGLPLEQQNWNAAFGALYLANVNWEFFAFGRYNQKVKTSESMLARDESDLEQEKFRHSIRVASAYLNLLAAQRLRLSQEKNLDRALVFQKNARTRAGNGLIAGVDSSLAAAEASNARIALTRARDNEQQQANQLAVLMGVTATEFTLDTTFIGKIPAASIISSAEKEHPVLKYYQARVEVSERQRKYFRTFYFPTFSLFGVLQTRGSGFEPRYTQDQTAFSHDYITGISPSRGNYLVGIGLTWNITSLARNNAQVKSQQFITDALQAEYDQAGLELKANLALAELKMKNALDNYNEAPVQVNAAMQAYTQKNALYTNGLSTIVELTQALYTLNRAETDRDIAYANVWQALLLEAAASGNLNLFMNEF